MEKWKAFKKKSKEEADKSGFGAPDAKERLMQGFFGGQKQETPEEKKKFGFGKVRAMLGRK